MAAAVNRAECDDTVTTGPYLKNDYIELRAIYAAVEVSVLIYLRLLRPFNMMLSPLTTLSTVSSLCLPRYKISRISECLPSDGV